MLTAATVLMAAYGLYSAGLGLAVVLGLVALEWWAGAALALFGVVLALAGLLVRVKFPGSFPLALGAMLALQALSLHNDTHFYGRIVPLFQAGRAALGVFILLVAVAGRLGERENRPR